MERENEMIVISHRLFYGQYVQAGIATPRAVISSKARNLFRLRENGVYAKNEKRENRHQEPYGQSQP